MSVPLEDGEAQNFYKLLEVMQTQGNLHTQQLVEDFEASVRGMDSVVRIKCNRTLFDSTYIEYTIMYACLHAYVHSMAL